MISGKTENYQTPFHFNREGAIGHYFPDAIITALKTLTSGSRGMLRTEPPLRPISLDEAKAHIIEALTQFDSSMGEDAAQILAEGSPQLNIHEIVGQPEKMGVRQAGLRKQDMLQHPDPVQAKIDAENLPYIVNDLPCAVIDFDYNGTLDAVIYLSHEVGHAIADNRQNSYRDNPIHMEETQAYFTQSIVTNHLRSIAEQDPNLAHAAQVHWHNNRINQIDDLKTALDRMSERVHYRAPSALIAETLVNHLGTQNAETVRATSDMLMGGQGALGINVALSRAGIETPDNLITALHAPTQQTRPSNNFTSTAPSPTAKA